MTHPVEPLRMVATLRSHGATFVLVGGVATAVRGGSIEIDDVDIAIPPDPENYRRVAVALRNLAAVPIGDLAADRSSYDTSWGPLDVIELPDSFATLDEHATEEDLGHGVTARVASTEDLIALKRRSGDLATVVNLVHLHEAEEAAIVTIADDEDEFGSKREQRDWPHWLDRVWTAFEDIDAFLSRVVYGDRNAHSG